MLSAYLVMDLFKFKPIFAFTNLKFFLESYNGNNDKNDNDNDDDDNIDNNNDDNNDDNIEENNDNIDHNHNRNHNIYLLGFIPRTYFSSIHMNINCKHKT